MKTRTFTVLLFLVAALATVSLIQWRQLRALRTELAATRAALAEESTVRQTQQMQLVQAERQQTRIREDLDKSAGIITTLRASESRHASDLAELATQSKAQTNAAAEGDGSHPDGLFGGKNMSAMFTRMMKDPAMKEMMRSQQRAVTQKMYGPLLKDLNLTPEQRDLFLQVLSDSQAAATDHAAKLFDSEGATKAEAMAELKEQSTAMEAQLKTILGEEKYAQYQDYKKTMGDRMALDDFKQRLVEGTMALSDQQTAGLVQVMKEERERVPQALPQTAEDMPKDFTEMFKSGVLEKQFEWQANYDRRVLERAGTILTPEQTKELADFQAQRLNLQKLSMKMATQLMGGSQTESPPANPAPVQ